MDKAFPWLIAFMLTQVFMMALAALPLKRALPGK
jgi:hypothetical protein